MHTLYRLSDILSSIVNRLGRLTAWLNLALMAVILFDVVTRRFLVLGSTKLQELEWHIHGALLLLSLGYAYLQSAHVRIEVVRERFPPRLQAWIELLGCALFVIPYCLMLVYFGADFVERAYAIQESSAALTGLSHRWIIKAAIPLGFGLLGLAAIATGLKAVLYLFGPPSLAALTHFEAIHMTRPQDEADANLPHPHG